MSATSKLPGKLSDEDQAAIDAYFKKGGKVTRGKTNEMSNELGISNYTWGNRLSKKEKQAKEGKK